jgi:large subunit ribosomal protein L23
MGIFSKNDNSKAKTAPKKVAKKTETKEKSVEVKASKGVSNLETSRIIKNPRITEKAANVSDNNVYTFDVYPKATKIEIVKAIKAAYGFTPINVNVLAIPTKKVWRTTANGVKRGGRKAYVTLKKGDKIEFI